MKSTLRWTKAKETQVNHPTGLCIDGTLAHYWIIDTPSGPLSKGVCERCRSVFNDFKNYLEVKHITLEGEPDPTREPYVTPWRGAGGTITQ